MFWSVINHFWYLDTKYANKWYFYTVYLGNHDVRIWEADQIVDKLRKYDKNVGKVYEVVVLKYSYLEENNIPLNRVLLVSDLQVRVQYLWYRFKDISCFLFSWLSLSSKTSRKRLNVQNVFRFLPLLRDKASKGMSNGSVMVPLLKPLLSPHCFVIFVTTSLPLPGPMISTCVKEMSLPLQVLNTLCNHLMARWRMSSLNWMNMNCISCASPNVFRFQKCFHPFSQAENMVLRVTSFLEQEMPITCLKKSSSKRSKRILQETISFFCIGESTFLTLMVNTWYLFMKNLLVRVK